MFGSGKDDKSAIGATPAKRALDQAQDGEDTGWIGAQAGYLVRRLLDVGIDGRGPFDSAAEVAAKALRKAGGNGEKAIDHIVASHLKMAGVSGFITSLGGYFTMPISLPTNVAGFYVLATRMTAAVATVRGYDLDQPVIRSAVLLSLVGADADDLLAKAGIVSPSGRLTALATERLPNTALMLMNKAIGFKILTTAGKQGLTRFGRNVPLVGGVLGGGLDAWLIHRIATSARTEFPPLARQLER